MNINQNSLSRTFTAGNTPSFTTTSHSYISLKVFIHQIPAVVLPESGNGTGVGFPQQAETETTVNMHPDVFLR